MAGTTRKKVKKSISIQESWALYSAYQKIREQDIFAYAMEIPSYVLRILTEQDTPAAKKKCSSRRAPGVSDQYSYTAYRFRGCPTAEQAAALNNNIGGARWMYNRLKSDSDALFELVGVYFTNTPADYKDLDGLEWLRSVDSYALCNAQLSFEKARSRWLSGDSGKPRFKKRHKCTASYTTNKDKRCNNISLDGDKLVLPKVPGEVKLSLHRKVKAGGTIKSVTVTHEPDGKWYFSILVEYPAVDLPESGISSGLRTFLETRDIDAVKAIGLDMSLPNLFIDSEGRTPSYTLDGKAIVFEKAYRKLEKRIAREQRRLSNMKYDSANYRRQCVKVARLHAKAKHQRSDFLHQVAVRLAREYDIICIEDLDMAAMKKALRFGKSVSDNGWSAFTRILEKKCLQEGCMLVRVDKWFPSSKTCSACGYIHKELKLNDRLYICPKCGHAMDRDKQAAINIKREGLQMVFDEIFPPATKKAA